MPERAVIHGVFAPLFDRLRATKTPAEPYFLEEGNRSALQASVGRELGLLFNTRTSTPSALYAVRDLTTIDYGIPDLVNYFTFSSQDQETLAFFLKRAIQAFEPRLKVRQISIESSRSHPVELWVTIEGMLIGETFLESAFFAVTFPSDKSKQVEVKSQPRFVIKDEQKGRHPRCY